MASDISRESNEDTVDDAVDLEEAEPFEEKNDTELDFDTGTSTTSVDETNEGVSTTTDESSGSSSPGALRTNMQYCSHCGSEISTEAEICPECGVRLETNEKSPAVAALLSAVVNGGGQLYNGDVAKGAIIFGVQIVNVMLMFVLIGFLTFPLVWLYSVYDAYKTAQSR